MSWRIRLSWWGFCKRLYQKYEANEVGDGAATIGYYLIFSLFPFLFIDHLVDRNTPAVLAALPAPKQDFPSLLAVAKQTLAMEQGNTRGINAVFEAAVAAKDYPAQVLMHWFINEQVEEEAWATELIDRVERADCAGSREQLDRHIEKILAGE